MIEFPARIPPHNLDAERAVLGAVLLEGASALAKVSGLIRSDFFTDAHSTVFGVMLELGARDEAIDLITVSEELRRRDELEFVGGAPLLALLVEQASIYAHLPSYVTIVRDMAVLRDLIQAATQTITDAFDAKLDAQVVLDQSAARHERLAQRAVIADALPVHTWAQMVQRTREKLNYLWPGWIVEKKVILVAGAGDSMKSFLCVFLAAMVAAGKPALEPDDTDTPCSQGPALIVSAENGYDEETRRVQLLRRGHQLPDDLPFTVLEADQLSLRDPETWTSFTALVSNLQPRVIVIDSGISVADLDNENDNAAVAAFMKKCIAPLARVHGASVLLIVHSPKPPTQRGSLPFTDEHVARGASAWRNAADGVLYLKRDKSLGKDAVVLRPAKVRSGFRHPPIWFRVETTEKDADGQDTAVQVRYGGEFTEETGQASEKAAALVKAIPVAIQVLKTTPGSRVTKLLESVVAAGVTEATARRAIAVIRGQQPWPSGPYRDKKQAVVDEAPGPRKMVYLTFNTSLSVPTEAPEPDEDDLPF